MPTTRARPRPEPWVKRKESIRYGWLTPFYWLEWIWEWNTHVLSSWAFLEFLEYLGRFSVLVAVTFYFWETPDRHKQKHYQAWQVINTAQGKGGSGGRIEALQELNRDHVPLVGVNAAGAFLMGVRLEKAHLLRSDFSAADLRSSDLKSADLEFSNLKEANLRSGDLRNASLENANLADADLSEANLSGADLGGASLARTNLRGCDMKDLKWKDISGIKLANIFQVKNAPPGFIDWATQNGAVAIASDDEWLRLTAAQPQN